MGRHVAQAQFIGWRFSSTDTTGRAELRARNTQVHGAIMRVLLSKDARSVRPSGKVWRSNPPLESHRQVTQRTDKIRVGNLNCMALRLLEEQSPRVVPANCDATPPEAQAPVPCEPLCQSDIQKRGFTLPLNPLVVYQKGGHYAHQSKAIPEIRKFTAVGRLDLVRSDCRIRTRCASFPVY
jgi:hypothetical protein